MKKARLRGLDHSTVGAQKRTRTSTEFPPLAPEASASTNSAIWALQEPQFCPGATVVSTVCDEILQQRRHGTFRGLVMHALRARAHASGIRHQASGIRHPVWGMGHESVHLRSVAVAWRRHVAHPRQCTGAQKSAGNKKPPDYSEGSMIGAQKRTRTSTELPPLAPEASASTNSAIWALQEREFCGDCRSVSRLEAKKFHMRLSVSAFGAVAVGRWRGPGGSREAMDAGLMGARRFQKAC
jgi:hypothetical protein